jgi:hypothetical protein
MSKAGDGPCSAPVPTATVAAAAVQKQKSLLQKADADVSSLVDNFSSLINIARVCPCASVHPRIWQPEALRTNPSSECHG